MSKHRYPHGRVALVTGASSGIGLAAAKALHAAGYTVYGASRRGTLAKDAAGVYPLTMDVTSETSIQAALSSIRADGRQVALLVHAAGNGLYGPLEVSGAEDAALQMDVNYYGALRLVRALLPAMRENESGLLLFIGSVGGIFPVPFQGLYSASKAALQLYVEALRLECRPFGVKAALIAPGDVKTGFTNARQPVHLQTPACYRAAMQTAVGRMERDEHNGMPPERVAAAVLRVAQTKSPPACTIVGGMYRVFVVLKRLLPARLVERLLYKVYLG